ncbi:MAG: hypothetical protein II676_03900 [Bacteroidales bacterium]|nr:hypothetical protein [Bacteroidales bacterium]
MDAMLSETTAIKKNNGWLDWITVLLALIVVIRHASLPDWFDKGYAVFDRIGGGLVTITSQIVPYFFILAGCIFFRNMPQKPSLNWFGYMYKRSLFVVLIPYLIANAITLAIYVAAHKVAPDMLSGFLGDNWKNLAFIVWKGPINLSLWLVRELILLCLLAPLIWLFVRYTWGGGVVVIGILWYYHLIPEPLFWFSVGTAIALLFVHSNKCKGWLDRHPLPFAPFWKDWAWFVFLYHYIPQLAMKKVGVALLPKVTSGGLLAVWIGNAVILLLGLTLIYYLLYRFAPKLVAILTGGH